MKIKIKTLYSFGFPYHALLTENGEVILRLIDKNYKLACKIRKTMLENSKLLGQYFNEN